ncbi:MAG: serine protease [Cyanobacteria bacterium SZAS LIN-5]|nr:serine protease [Cyanobacteria bacterium SZAS LIN-5]RTL34599.1 MAG: serine protease [Candidatus Melainabacteria bacterium]
MSQDRGEVPSDGERLPDRGQPPEEDQVRNTMPSQVAASYDMFGNPLMPAAPDRVPGGDRGNLGQNDGDRGNALSSGNSTAPQPVPIVYTEKKPISNNVKIAALVGSIFAVGTLVFVLMANPLKQSSSDNKTGTNTGFRIAMPELPKQVLSPHEIFKTCGPSIVTLQIQTKAYQVSIPKYDLVSISDPESPILAVLDDDDQPHLYQQGKAVSAAGGIVVTSRGKIPAIIKLSGTTPVISLIDSNGVKRAEIRGVLEKYLTVATGSGFFVRPDIVVTNYHVVSNGDLGVAGYMGGTAQITDDPAKYELTRKPIASDKEHDLALVYVPGTKAKTLPMRTDFGSLTVGEPVYALGSPKGVAGSMSEGLISSDKLRGKNPRDPDLPKLYLQHSAKIDHGNSGGPLVNNRGEVIGVNTAGVGNGTVNLAVVAKFIEDLLNQPDTQAKIDQLQKANQTDLRGG